MANAKDSIVAVLERELTPTIEQWLKRVEKLPGLTSTPLSSKQRAGHLPRLLTDLIRRLHAIEGRFHPKAFSAHEHGKARFTQGYSVAMLVEESRLLELSLFDTLHRHQKKVDPQQMMLGVMIIADECGEQLKHTVEAFLYFEKREHAAA